MQALRARTEVYNFQPSLKLWFNKSSEALNFKHDID